MLLVCNNKDMVQFSHVKTILLILITLQDDICDCNLTNDAKNFLQKLMSLTEQSLFDRQVQNIYNNISRKETVNILDKSAKILHQNVDRVKYNIDIADKLLRAMKKTIETIYENYPNGEQRQLKSCCVYDENLRRNDLFQSDINLDDMCELKPTYCTLSLQTTSTTEMNVLNKQELLSSFKRYFQETNGRTRHIYYGANDGYYVQYPAEKLKKTINNDCECDDFDARLRPWYVGTMTPKDGKDVVIAVDISNRMGSSSVLQEQMKIVVETLLKTVDVKDRILVALFPDANPSYPVTNCLNGKLTAASPAIKHEIKLFLEETFNMTFTGDLTYTGVFTTTYNKLKEQEIDKSRLKVVHFITAGSKTDLSTDIKKELQKKANEQNCSVVLNIFEVTENGLLPGNDDKTLINDACNCDWCSNKLSRNKYVYFTKADSFLNIQNKVVKTAYGSTSSLEKDSDIRYSLPYVAVTGLGAMVDACIRIEHSNEVRGILCVAFYIKELFDVESADFRTSEDSYVFVIDNNGLSYIHPLLAMPVFESDQFFPLNIVHLEPSDEFKNVSSNMTSGIPGRKTANVSISIPQDQGARLKTKQYTYTWKKVDGSPFVICVVISSEYHELKLNVDNLKSETTERYHRLDLYNKSSKFCLLKDEVAINDSSVLKLTYKVFKKPLTYYEDETLKSTMELMEYFEKKTDSAPINTFRTSDDSILLRRNILATSGVVKLWLKDNSTDSAYILGRYIGTDDGTLRMYPGTLIHPFYDPRVRFWYRLATSTDGLFVLTQPYVDASSNTTLVSLVKTIYRNEDYSKQVAGNIALDLSIGYIYSLILSTTSDCHSFSNDQCILLTQSGYVIFHNNFLKKDAIIRRDYHITEMEPATAAHLIEKGYLKKDYCIGYHKTTKFSEEKFRNFPPVAHLLWFYSFDRFPNVIVDDLNNDGTCQYELIEIQNTNMVLLKMKKKCSFEVTKNSDSCKCATDPMKTCIMSDSFNNLKTKCECPCHQYIPCLGNLPLLKNSLICSPPNELTQLKDLYSPDWYENENKRKLEKCFDPKCETSKNSIECNRLDCKWCFQYGNGSDLPDKERFCTDEKKECFPVKYPSTPNPKDESSDELKIIIPIVVVIIIVIIICVTLLYTRKQKQLKTTNDSKNELPETQQTQITNQTTNQVFERKQSFQQDIEESWSF